MDSTQNSNTRTWQRPELRRVTTKTTAAGDGPDEDAFTGSTPV